MRRLVVVQLAIFAVIAAIVIPFGIRYVAGPLGFRTPMTLTATMTDAFGLTTGTSVTVRGVQVGTVDDVWLSSDGTAMVRLSIDPDTKIPRDAILTVGMGTAAGIQSVDIMPQSDAGPYLASGDTIAAPADRQPIQMDRIMGDTAQLVKGIDTQAVRDVGTELSNAFDGLGPDLAMLIDNASDMSTRIRNQTGQLQPLIDGTAELVTTMAGQGDTFIRGMGASARLANQLDGSGPAFLYLTDRSPAALKSLQRVLDTYQGTFGATLANLATVTPIIGDRTDSLQTGLSTIPKGLQDLTSIVKLDATGQTRADFSLIATQGPVCNYDVDRRAIGDVSPTEPNLVMYCPPAPDMLMRGAVNAPRPNDLGMQNSQIPGYPIGPEVVNDPVKIPTLAQLAYKWRSILKGGPQ
ncbi:MlaD family protein [Mycolicibacterium fortuitum]|uniref:MlaD family protein n=1 Tax=Mycolicibacterium fortuitum TaxID=1766 RepID=UPI00053629B0|nr:MlaD family protein [Mycolicibacterium fortuitum]CRL73039.1 virulence factor Mce family protein [Mycolicibacter nonchromogenicus]AMD55783.1 mammalian cell entry protein [Mycolicibacterium fortuitum subsp. fortuitum DSM 46621 = ATCC 6841 = JCM 6387]MCA4726837.1 MCE family protein [Mycolicibacterium fortuitum]WEV31955.1 MCE family protein [Mycolicibacterium fortuitum]CRL52885.1 virulence factor Mce family protein [Mycolicibacterium fortuitum subsp. fortuitum DSM 46621 = ATCC 6841 = JCM 6387]